MGVSGLDRGRGTVVGVIGGRFWGGRFGYGDWGREGSLESAFVRFRYVGLATRRNESGADDRVAVGTVSMGDFKHFSESLKTL